MRIFWTINLALTLKYLAAQTPIKKVDGIYTDANKDYKSSLQLDLNPDNTFNYTFHHSVGSCYAKGVWRNHRDTITLIRARNKNHSDSLEIRIFPNFIGKENWFFRNDTLYLLDKSKLTNVMLKRN